MSSRRVTIASCHDILNKYIRSKLWMTLLNSHFFFTEEENGWTVLTDKKDITESGLPRLKVKKNRVKVRLDHFTWYTPIIEYFTGTMSMEMLMYMEPPSVSRAKIVFLRIYVIRKDESAVSSIKARHYGHYAKVSLWYVSLLTNTRFRFFFFFLNFRMNNTFSVFLFLRPHLMLNQEKEVPKD